MPRADPQLQPRLRFLHAGADAFGPGKAELLRHIAVTGSIRTAARWARRVTSIEIVSLAPRP